MSLIVCSSIHKCHVNHCSDGNSILHILSSSQCEIQLFVSHQMESLPLRPLCVIKEAVCEHIPCNLYLCRSLLDLHSFLSRKGIDVESGIIFLPPEAVCGIVRKQWP